MRKRWWLLLPALLLIFYFMGPHPANPVYSTLFPQVPTDTAALDAYVQEQEGLHHLKADNEARIVWADTPKRKTRYALVYLHGFSSSQGEGDPVHREIARKYDCNLYLSRLADHGIDSPEALINLDADRYWESAKQALASGLRLGDSVILMGTSTGGTLALQLAAAYPDKVAALVLLSPNIAINDSKAWLLEKPWGLQIARFVKKSNYLVTEGDRGPLYNKYWYTKYRLEGAVALGKLVSTTMTKSTFERVKQPVALFYYYKDEVHQDSTVKVSAELEMFDQLGTPAPLRFKEAIPNAGAHVLSSPVTSHDVPAVKAGIEHFLSDILHLKPAPAPTPFPR